MNPKWSQSRSRVPQSVANKTPRETEKAIVYLRDRLNNANEFYGALAIQWAMEDLGYRIYHM